MPEVVALADTDQRLRWGKQLECLGGKPIITPMMRHLQYLDRLQAHTGRSALQRCPLGIAPQHRIEPVTLQP